MCEWVSDRVCEWVSDRVCEGVIGGVRGCDRVCGGGGVPVEPQGGR